MPEDRSDDRPKAPDASAPRPEPVDRLVETRHETTIGGVTIPYVATAGTTVLREEVEGEGERAGRREGHRPRAEVFTVSYVRDDVEDRATRPVAFCFNGGPGSSSVWLHLGAFGPRRVELDDEGVAGPPPYRLVDNEHGLLDATDLVFIDPVGTGWSRATEGEDAKGWYGFGRDLDLVAETIRLWCARNGRWRSPKFLAGESYGTTRAAALARRLQERHGVHLNGLALVSTVLDFSTLLFGPGNDLPPVVYLPTYAAVAHYHGRLEPELQERDLDGLLREVEAYALGPYASALLQGDRLDDDARREVAERVARYTGLRPEYVLATDLRVEIMRFCKELLRDEARTVGRLDARYTGRDRDAAGESFESDPSYDAIRGAFAAGLNDLVRSELRFESDLPYELLSFAVNRAWSYKEFEGRYVHVAEDLRAAMSQNPWLRVHVAQGLYDLATPHFASDHALAHLGLAPELRGNVSRSYYASGHMMYVHAPSRAKLRSELAEFVTADLP